MTLIKCLEAATEGSRELDMEVRTAIVDPTNPFQDRSAINPPPYTTSIDAKLPNENIYRVEFDFGSCLWEARQRSDDAEPVGDFIGYGNSEPLARRIAALKARQ